MFFKWRTLSNTGRWKMNHKTPSLCLWSFRVTKMVFKRPSCHLETWNQVHEQQRALSFSRRGTACRARDNGVSLLCCLGSCSRERELVQIPKGSSASWALRSKLWFAGGDMFPILYEQRDRGPWASAQMFARGALCLFGSSANNLKSRSSSRCQCFFCTFKSHFFLKS